MNNIHVREATKICFERYCYKFQKYLTDSELALCNEAIKSINIYPIDKLSRWLGFIQGILIERKATTIDAERDFSREYFHEAYLKDGIEIPKTFDSKIKENKNVQK